MAAVFPYLPGISWPVARSEGRFDTTTLEAMSGKQSRFANRTQATYQYAIPIEALDSNGSNAGLIAHTKQALSGFFNQTLGGALIFNFYDVDDGMAAAQPFGLGDGVTTAFQLARASGGWTDNILAPLNAATPTLIGSPSGGQIYAPNNLLSYSNSLTNAAWLLNNATIAGGVADPLGGTNAFTLTSTAAGGLIANVVGSLSASLPLVSSVWARRRTGSGVVGFNAPPDNGGNLLALTSAWNRFSVAGIGGAYTALPVQLFTNGDAVDLYAPQMESSNTGLPGSSIITLSQPNPGVPQIFVAGVMQDPSTYTVGATGIITFASPPAASAALTWSGAYYWPCNFDDDSLSVSKFMSGLWEAKSLKFTTRIY